jgi:DNA-binding transcriptional MerR regulator/methylmalonyl-CoA mutase cobalamin-binding subunit
MSQPSYRIGTLARLTGVSTHALRIWERRYSALTPSRTPKGARLYSAADLERVGLLKQLTDAEHAIGTIAQLSLKQLRELAQRSSSLGSAPVNGGGARDLAAELVDAATALDVERARAMLRQASARYSPRDMLLSLVLPVLQEVGRRWQDRQLCVASEHAVTALLRTHMGQLLSLAPATGAAIVCATPAGELHELGALFVAVLISVHGRRPVYLGPNLPADQIAEAAQLSGASAVALSVVSLEARRAEAELSAVARALPRTVELVLGGGGLSRLESLPKRAIVLRNLVELERWLESKASQAPKRPASRARRRTGL